MGFDSVENEWHSLSTIPVYANIMHTNDHNYLSCLVVNMSVLHMSFFIILYLNLFFGQKPSLIW